MVFPLASFGKPAPDDELDVTVMAPVLPSICTEATYLDTFDWWAVLVLKDVAKLLKPLSPPDIHASQTPVLAASATLIN